MKSLRGSIIKESRNYLSVLSADAHVLPELKTKIDIVVFFYIKMNDDDINVVKTGPAGSTGNRPQHRSG
jgi:hypothetical protein